VPRPRLSDTTILMVRTMHSQGESYSSIARQIGRSVSTVEMICRGLRYKSVGGPTLGREKKLNMAPVQCAYEGCTCMVVQTKKTGRRKLYCCELHAHRSTSASEVVGRARKSIRHVMKLVALAEQARAVARVI